MSIKYNPYNWDIIKEESLPCPTKDDIQRIRKDLIEELYDAIEQPYVIEKDIDLLITKLYNFQHMFCSSE